MKDGALARSPRPRLGQKIAAMARLFRPELPAAAGVCVLIGQALANGGLPSVRQAVLAFLAVFMLSGSALILNDLFDLEVDRVNAPHRPLPSGLVTPAEVIGLTIAATLLGFAAAAGLSLPLLLMSIPIWLIGFLYNWRFKQHGLMGNLMVAASVASTFLFGALSVNNLANPLVWIFSLMAFYVDLGEEIAGDIVDMEGDRLRGSRSIPIQSGKRAAMRWVFAAWFLVIGLSYLPVLLGLLGLPYAVMITITNLLFAYFAVQFLRDRSLPASRTAMRGVYISASLGMLAFFISLLLR